MFSTLFFFFEDAKRKADEEKMGDERGKVERKKKLYDFEIFMFLFGFFFVVEVEIKLN